MPINILVRKDANNLVPLTVADQAAVDVYARDYQVYNVTAGVPGTAYGPTVTKVKSEHVTFGTDGLLKTGPLGETIATVQSIGVIIDGDSLMARNWNEQAISSAARSGAVATATFNSHGVPIGSDVVIHGYDDPLWNGTKTVTAITTNTFSFAISESSESAPTTGLHTPTFLARAHRRHDGYFNWAEWLSGKDYNLAFNCARGARLLSEINSDFDGTVAAQSPGGVYILQGGTNDCNQAIATATSCAEMESIIQKAQRRGLSVILATVPPFVGATNTTAKANAFLALNKEIRKFARTYRCKVLDVYAMCVDPASATAAGVTAYVDTSDSIHLTPTFCKIVGAELYAMLDNLGLGSPIQLPSSLGDISSVLTSSNNVLDGLFAGIGGTESGGATGDTATGWTLANASIATVTASKGTGTVGASQIVTVAGSSGSYSMTGPSMTASFSAGDVVRFVGKISCTMDLAYRMTMGLALTDGGVNSEIRAMSSPGATLAMPAGTYTVTFQSEPFKIPAGVTYSKFRPEPVVVLTGATTGALEFSQFGVRKIA